MKDKEKWNKIKSLNVKCHHVIIIIKKIDCGRYLRIQCGFFFIPLIEKSIALISECHLLVLQYVESSGATTVSLISHVSYFVEYTHELFQKPKNIKLFYKLLETVILLFRLKKDQCYIKNTSLRLKGMFLHSSAYI